MMIDATNQLMPVIEGLNALLVLSAAVIVSGALRRPLVAWLHGIRRPKVTLNDTTALADHAITPH